MKEINITSRNSMSSIVARLIKKYEDDLYLTFDLFLDNNHVVRSTFGSDNMEHCIYWLAVQQAKLISGSIDSIVLEVRVFTDKVKITYKGKRKFKMPIKDLYYFHFSDSKIILFDGAESMKVNTINHATGNKIPKDDSVTYKSSIDLMDQLK